jgi:D-alanyl-D-alanine carboxypeptidase
VCGPHRKRPAAEDEDVDAGENGGADSPFSAMLSSLRAPTPKGAALLSDLGAVTPVVVYTGPTRTPDQIAKLSVEQPTPHHRKKGAGKTAKARAEKAGDENAGGETAADGKATEAKGADAKAAEAKGAEAKTDEGKTRSKRAHWTPTSSATLAATPPPELETKHAAEKPKRRHKAATAAKPAASTAPATQ